MRYRLSDIDLLINRTLVYLALTICVVGLYVVVVGCLGLLFHTTTNLLISLLTTGVVAVLFQPLRARLQRVVNRMLYGHRDEPYAVIANLGRRLESTLAPDTVLPTIVETVAHALKLPYVAITLRHHDGFRVAAAYGHAQPTIVILPLRYQAELVGQLLLGQRTPGEAFSSTDRQLLEMLADRAGAAAHAVRLTTDLQQLTVDLQATRERLVNAREEERRRLRRDLHDGIGPTLASLTQRLDLARALVLPDPQAAQTLLRELKGQTRATIADIRHLVYALRPPVLDELGLVSAIHEHAAQIGTPDALHVTVLAPPTLPALPAAVEVAAYRIVLEAVTNVVRHAQARTCIIDITLVTHDTRHTLCLEVRDDGAGIPDDQRTGVGIQSMYERSAELGGVCTVSSLPTRGTRVCAWLPLQP